MARRAVALSLLLAFASGPSLAADDPDLEADRLAAALASLDADPNLLGRARLERYQADQALAALRQAKRRDREQALVLAEAYVEAARDAAQAEQLMELSRQLDRERDQMMLEASRREADLARREAERLRLDALAREEEAARLAAAQEQERLAAEQQLGAELEAANAQTSQAMKLAEARARENELARQQAELAAALEAEEGGGKASPPPVRTVGKRRVYTLPGTAFASGSDRVSASAQASLRALAAEVSGKRLRIEAHTDSQGSDASNLALSEKRAQAVRQVLASAGLPAGRLAAVGKGESDPVTDNGSAEGRARNRRVEIIVE